jgi:hypothetical protein
MTVRRVTVVLSCSIYQRGPLFIRILKKSAVSVCMLMTAVIELNDFSSNLLGYPFSLADPFLSLVIIVIRQVSALD